MTYCLALCLDAGVVLLADTRTNAGVDNISTYAKLFTWTDAGGADHAPRALAAMTSGNLSITQEVLGVVEEEIAADRRAPGSAGETILNAPSLFRVAQHIGDRMSEVQQRRGAQLAAAGVSGAAAIVVAGQIAGDRPRIFLVYQAGNCIEATADTPYLQIGEFKYGKPILDRVVTPATSLSDGVKAALLSMDGTIRSNLSVGLPLDLAVLRTDAFAWRTKRIGKYDEGFSALSRGWGESLRQAFAAMPETPLD